MNNTLKKAIKLLESIIGKEVKLIDEGVKYDETSKQFKLDWKDDENSILNLKNENRPIKKFFKRGGLKMFVGYIFNKVVKGTDESKRRIEFQNKLKNLEIDSKDLDQLITKAIINLSLVDNVSEIDLIITPSSSGTLSNYIALKLKEKTGKNTLFVKDAIIKSLSDEITLDDNTEEKIGDVQTEKLRKSIKKSEEKNGYFKIKDVYPPYRRFVKNFYKFKDETKQEIYNKIKNGKVVIVDDFWTTGATLTEISKMLTELGNKNHYAFIMISST